MKVSTWKRQQRHVRARRKYWASVYTQNGLRRVPMPFVECYTEEGEIVPLPPIEWNKAAPLLNMLPRESRPGFPMMEMDWKSTIGRFSAQQEVEV